jgi:hypothetical protein
MTVDRGMVFIHSFIHSPRLMLRTKPIMCVNVGGLSEGVVHLQQKT